jgi:hypothetical protein
MPILYVWLSRMLRTTDRQSVPLPA